MNEITKYISNGKELSLSADIAKKYLVNGNATITDQEVFLFVHQCIDMGLNPFIREVYLIKYDGSKPAQIVTGITAIRRLAMANPTYCGHQPGIIVENREGKIEKRKGTFLIAREKLLGGWCDSRKMTPDGIFVSEHQVSLDEFMKMKDGKPQAQWGVMPATMISKVAEAQGLRQTFNLTGMYDPAELGIDEKLLDKTPVDLSAVKDITPNDPIAPTKEPEKTKTHLEFLIDLSDADFLESNITVKGKTKMIKDISVDTWRAIEQHESTAQDLRSVSYRALGLLDNEPLMNQPDLFEGTPFPSEN